MGAKRRLYMAQAALMWMLPAVRATLIITHKTLCWMVRTAPWGSYQTRHLVVSSGSTVCGCKRTTHLSGVV